MHTEIIEASDAIMKDGRLPPNHLGVDEEGLERWIELCEIAPVWDRRGFE